MDILFKSITELKEVVSVTKALTLSSIAPAMESAISSYIIDEISQEFWDEILNAYNADPGTPLTTEQQKVVKLLQKCIGRFGVYEYIPEAEVMFGEDGITRVETAQKKTAYANQVKSLADNMLKSGYEALENLLKFLEDNEADYPTWVSSSAYSKNKDKIINSAKQFREHYPLQYGRQLYKKLVPTMVDVQNLYIVPVIGQDYFDHLIASITDKNIASVDKPVLLFLEKSVAHLTVMESVKIGWTHFGPEGITFIEHDGNTNKRLMKIASAESVSLKIRQANIYGERYLSKVKSILDANLDDFPAYRDDVVVNPPEEEIEPINKDRYDNSTGNLFNA